MAQPPETFGIRHIALVTGDLPKAEAFYCSLLGYQIEWRPDADNLYLTMRGQDNLALHKGDAGAETRLGHFGIILKKAEDVDAWHEHMKAFAVKDPQTHRDGARSFYAKDPDGNNIQFIYHPPIADKTCYSGPMQIATATQRFLASLTDGLIVGVPYLTSVLEFIPNPFRFAGGAFLVVLLLVQLVLLSRHGQTIGKRLLGIRIVDKDSAENGGFLVNVVKRGFLNGLLCLIPGYFLVDSLFIFRKNRRCLHDLIARTIVVQIPSGVVE